MNDHQIIAHRGESFDAPENTLASITMAWQKGATAVEIDIQLTKDNKIVVIHDYNTHRVSGIRKRVKKSTLSELKKLDIGSFKDKKWKDQRIPTLEEVLKTIPDNGKLIIEIKSNEQILKPLKELLDKTALKTGQIELIAFNYKTIVEAKILMPKYTMLWLVELDYLLPWWLCFTNTERLIKKVKQGNIDGLDIWAGKIANKPFIEKLKDANLLVYFWTVNDALVAKQLIENGAIGITTDRACWLTEQLKH